MIDNNKRTFVSGSADTTQLIQIQTSSSSSSINTANNNDVGTTIIKQHNHVCFHKHNSLPYDIVVNDGRQKCCFELYQNGLLNRNDYRQYCLNHVALVPNVNTIRNIISREDKFDVVPVYYLVMEEEVVLDPTHDNSI